MEPLVSFLQSTWTLMAEMAPWLLLGFGIAGVLSQLMPTRFIQKHLQRPGVASVVKAVGLGIPLPLCSCGVIPVAAQLRRSGASRGAVAAFTMATPQTGIDSIAATYSLMGWPFTLGRLAANVVSGLFTGLAINARRRSAPDDTDTDGANGLKPCCRSEANAPPRNTATTQPPWPQQLRAVVREGWITLPGDIGGALVTGILIGGALGAWIPSGALAQSTGAGLLTYALVTVLSVPLYVCATGSIPMAFGLVAAGLSPGAAMVFLIAGPATNAATLAALARLIGRTETMIYLGTLTATAWAAAFIFDQMEFPTRPESMEHAMELSWYGHASALALSILLAHALYRKRRSKPTP